MKNALLLFIVTLLNCCTINAQDSVSFKRDHYIASDGFNLPYRVKYPENFDLNKSYPILLFLHGAGERGSDNNAQLKNGFEALNSAPTEAIIIAPQCPKDSYWGSVKVDRNTRPFTFDFNYSRPVMPPLNAAIELVKTYQRQGLADPEQTYIMGLSMGGMGTFEAVYRNPNLFKAAAPICGGADVNAFNENTKDVAFWVFHGDSDSVVPVDFSRKMYKRLNEIGNEVTYTEYPGVDHNSWDNVFADPLVLIWLFEH